MGARADCPLPLLGAFGPVTLPRLVLDTSVLLPALLFPAGVLSWIPAAWRAEW